MKMYYSILFILFALISISNELFSELTFSPQFPVFGENISIQYIDKGKIFSNSDTVYLMIYGFSSNLTYPQAFNSPLLRNADYFTGNFTLPGNWVYAIAYIYQSEGKYDINYGKYWELFILNNERIIQRDANLFSSLIFMGSTSPNLNPQVNLDSALRRLEREVELYPDNFQAKVGLLSLRFDMKKITQDGFKEQANQLLSEKKQFSTEREIKSAYRLLNALNKNKEAESLISQFVQSNPLSKTAEEDAISKLSQADNFNNFIALAAVFLDRFPDSPDIDNVYSAVVTSFMQTNNIEQLYKFLSERKYITPEVYSKIAWEVFSKDNLLPLLRGEARLNFLDSLLNLAVNITNSRINSNVNKPIYLTDIEWKNNNLKILGSIMEIKGDVNAKLNPENAIQYYLKAIELLGNDATVNLYENAINIAEKSGDLDLTTNLIFNALINSFSSDYLITQFARNIRGENRQYVLDSLNQIAQTIRHKRYRNELLDIHRPGTLFLTSYDGRLISLDDLREKIFILAFWATWCGPCQATIPALEEISTVFSENDNVEIVLVSIWERQKDKKAALNAYFKRDFPNVPLAWDELDVLPMSLGITGLPVVIIFDKQGRGRFMINGFTNAQSYIDEIVDKTNFLIYLEELNED
jgi:thiol-disulfide isomerase/thioredoxin